MNLKPKVKKTILIGFSALIIIAATALTYLFKPEMVFDEVYGFKMFTGLLISVVLVSIGIAYFFSNVKSLASYKILLGKSLLLNLFTISFTILVLIGLNVFVPQVETLENINSKYMLYFFVVILNSLFLVISTFNKARLVSEKNTLSLFDKVNFLLPPLAFLLVGFFLVDFRSLTLALLVLSLLSFISVKVIETFFQPTKA
jgi:hypothetical protein